MFDSGDNVKQRKNLLQFYPFVRDYPGFKGSGQSIRQVAMESSRSLQRYPKRSGHSERSMRTKANATFGRKGKSARLSIITFFFFKPSYLKSGKYKFCKPRKVFYLIWDCFTSDNVSTGARNRTIQGRAGGSVRESAESVPTFERITGRIWND